MPLGLLTRDSIQDFGSMESSASSVGSGGDGRRVEQVSGSVPQPSTPRVNKKQQRNNKNRRHVQPQQQADPANPQQATSENSSSYKPYYYHDVGGVDFSYAEHDYSNGISSNNNSSTTVKSGSTGSSNNTDVMIWSSDGSGNRLGMLDKPPWWQCCLFPWLVQQQQRHQSLQEDPLEWDDADHEQVSAQAFSEASKKSGTEVAAADEPTATDMSQITDSSPATVADDTSNNSEVLGERLSDKERQAVLARLRLANGDAAPGNDQAASSGTSPPMQSSSPVPTQKGLLNGLDSGSSNALQEPKPLKSILRRSVLLQQDSQDDGASNMSSGVSLSSMDNGALLHSSSNVDSNASVASTGSANTKSTAVTAGAAGPRRRMLFPQYAPTNKSKNSTCSVHFAPMARVVTVTPVLNSQKADIWWTKLDYESFRRTGRMITKAMMEGGSEIWLSDTSAANCNVNTSSICANPTKANPTTFKKGDKWWHRFGHSRRGLEHVVSFDEGRQRQQNVRTAIASVLEEQARQARYNRVDGEKLRVVSLNHTNWARDLALASGESDADAVRSSFAEDRKSREFYLLKMAGKTPDIAPATRRLPEFMQSPTARRKELTPTSMMANVLTGGAKLDENTAAQISFRRAIQQEAQDKSSTAALSTSANDHQEPVRDTEKRSSLAQRAKGFSTGDDAKLDMGAVMSGLGPVAQHHSDSSSLCGTSPTSSICSATTRQPMPQAVSS